MGQIPRSIERVSSLKGLDSHIHAAVVITFLADRTKYVRGAFMLQCCVCLSVCMECIVVKRCVLEQKLLLTAYRKSYMRNRLVQK